MNIDRIVQKYFHGAGKLPLIEVFDENNIHDVFVDVVSVLKSNPEIELGVLQILSYCLYEILDNVITHSTKSCGTVLSSYLKEANTIKILVADDGIGIHKSLMENKEYSSITEEEAIMCCVEDKVTDGKGMGFGLYSTARMVQSIGIQFEIHSGAHLLSYNSGSFSISSAPLWQGTIVYIEIHSNKEISPNEIVDNRTDVEVEFTDEFINIDEIELLW